jgi:hypothetical protein
MASTGSTDTGTHVSTKRWEVAWPRGPAHHRLAGRTGQSDMLLVLGLALCFALAFLAEKIGLAGIVGAFAAGLLLDPDREGVRTPDAQAMLSELLRLLSSLFVPLFFVLMGIQVDVARLVARESLGFGIVLVLVAVAGKLACAGGWSARNQSVCRRHRDGAAGRSGPHLRGNWSDASARWPASRFGDGVRGASADGRRDNANQSDFGGPANPAGPAPITTAGRDSAVIRVLLLIGCQSTSDDTAVSTR